MITLDKNNVAEMMLFQILSEKYKANEKLRMFERKYNKNFEEFSDEIKNINENFEKYDDYIEWKAFRSILLNVNKEIEDLKNGNFQIT
jgi:hypothetical protein